MNSAARAFLVCGAATVALLADCSSTPPAPPGQTTTDAGGTSDTDSGTGGMSPIGGACSLDSDCAFGATCDTNLSGGYCTGQCATNADCPPGSVCGMVSGQAACEGTCSSTSQCRSGYTCDQASGGCLPGCSSDTDCDSTVSGGQYCDTSTNECVGGCQTDTDCPSATPTCDTSNNTCGATIGVPDAGETDAGTTDAGVPDSGVETDAGTGTCAGYAGPNTTAGCPCEANADAGESCTANNCYGGYYCELSTLKCVAAPTDCSSDGGTSETDAGSGGSGTCTTCTTSSDCASGSYCDCVDSACTMTTCTTACTAGCPSGWSCQAAEPASDPTDTTTYMDCLPTSDTCN